MIANFHTHTTRCRHAWDAEEDYITRALEGGLQTLGFSDHTPYWFQEDYYSTFRMFPEELGEYVDTVTALKEKYAGKIQIHLGLEAEYYPRYFPELLRRLGDTPVEYLLLGQHYPENEIGRTNVGFFPTEDGRALTEYYDQVIEALYTGVFTYVAHPDIFRFSGDPKVYKAQVRRLCQTAKACDIPLEINLLGLREGRHYPRSDFWEVAAEEGCKAVIGSDAHKAKDVWAPDAESKALALVQEYGLDLLATVDLRPVKV